MNAEGITVGVYALDRLDLPKPVAARGWAQRLAGAGPLPWDGSQVLTLHLAETGDGLVLAQAADLAGAVHRPGTRVSLEPVPARAAMFLVRIGGKALAVALASGCGADEAGPSVAAQSEALAAYAAATMIDTPDGPRAAGTLAAGDVVTTLANGSRPLRWVGRRQVSLLELLAFPGLRPVEFAPGTVGNGGALVVSPQQRMLIDDWRAEVYFGEDRVLVAAQALVDDRAARLILPRDGIDYVVLLCDRHEVLLAEGALSESFHPGEAGLAALAAPERAALAAIVPEDDLLRRRAAFPIVRNAEARALRT